MVNASDQYSAMQVTALGSPMTPARLTRQDPEAGQVRLRIRACGLNFGDLLILDGKYQEKRDLPFVAGMEVAGEIEAVGRGR